MTEFLNSARLGSVHLFEPARPYSHGPRGKRRRRAGELIDELHEEGLRDDEIRRVFEAELLRATEIATKR